jgi:hypothetical protein
MIPCLPLYQTHRNAWNAGKEAHLSGAQNSDFVDSGVELRLHSP